VRKRKKAKRPLGARVPLQAATRDLPPPAVPVLRKKSGLQG